MRIGKNFCRPHLRSTTHAQGEARSEATGGRGKSPTSQHRTTPSWAQAKAVDTAQAIAPPAASGQVPSIALQPAGPPTAEARGRQLIMRGDVEAVASLLDDPAGPSVASMWDVWGNYGGKQLNNEALVDVLLARSTPEIIAKHSWCMLGVITESMGVPLLEKLLKAGFSTHIAAWGSLLNLISRRNKFDDMDALVDVLVRYGADVNWNGAGGTPLTNACQPWSIYPPEVSLAAVRALLRCGADPNLQRVYDISLVGQDTPARVVSGCSLSGEAWATEALRLLVRHGATLDKICYGRTALGHALSWCNATGARALVTAGANPRLLGSCEENDRVLETVVLLKDSACVAAFLAAGKFTKAERRSALKLAYNNCDRATVEVLKRPANRLHEKGAGRTFVLSRLKDRWYRYIIA